MYTIKNLSLARRCYLPSPTFRKGVTTISQFGLAIQRSISGISGIFDKIGGLYSTLANVDCIKTKTITRWVSYIRIEEFVLEVDTKYPPFLSLDHVKPPPLA
jgi:hypothetical protein